MFRVVHKNLKRYHIACWNCNLPPRDEMFSHSSVWYGERAIHNPLWISRTRNMLVVAVNFGILNKRMFMYASNLVKGEILSLHLRLRVTLLSRLFSSTFHKTTDAYIAHMIFSWERSKFSKTSVLKLRHTSSRFRSEYLGPMNCIGIVCNCGLVHHLVEEVLGTPFGSLAL